jgi:flagellar biosynthesis/type III secretory pathway M-ring protein FliF/YscJ
MKKQNFNGNTNFWMILTIMLAVFIVLASTVLIVTNPFSKNVPKDSSATAVVEQQTESDTENNDFATTKDRVTDVNDNYGQSIKSTYAGDNSTMEAMMKQRMFFSGVKSTLIVILLLSAILLVIVKCFNISLFKKKQADTVDAGEPEISAEDRKYVRRAT